MLGQTQVSFNLSIWHVSLRKKIGIPVGACSFHCMIALENSARKLSERSQS